MKYLKSLLWVIIPFLISSLIITILYYFNIINDNIYTYTGLFSTLISLFIGGVYLGKHSSRKGWLEGLKLGGTIIIILFMINYLGFGYKLSLKIFIYYLILLLSITLGSMFGIRNIDKTN